MVGFLLGQWQTRARNSGHTDFPSSAVRLTLNAPASMLGGSLDWFADFGGGVLHSASLTAENRRLRAIAASASLYDERVDELNHEIAELRKLQGFPEVPNRTRVPARIIGIYAAENRILLNVGSAQGVSVGLPVLAADGLLAIVHTVDSQSCQAALIWSPLPFKMGAIVQHQPESSGLMHGETGGKIVLDLTSGSPVREGDLVITSGYSTRIPRGIPIGKVVQFQEDRDFGSEKVLIAPNVQLGDVREVFILR